MKEKKPPLIWANGEPMRTDILDQEISAPTTGSVRTIMSGHPAQGMDPYKLGKILLAAEQGDAIAYFELAEEMEEKDLHYLSVLGTRKRAVCQLPIDLEPAGDSADQKADAELVQKVLDRDMLEAELFDILDAVGKGVSTCEVMWNTARTPWLPRDIEWRKPEWFEFDKTDGKTLGRRENSGPVPLEPAKFISHIHKAKSGLPIRGGLARAVAWGYMFKNFALKDWVIFLEGYGHPLRLGTYGPNASEADKQILADALMDLGADAWGTIPETMAVEFVDRKAGTAPADLWQAKAKYWDEQISKAVLGQTNTTDAQSGGLGSGQANVHNEVRKDIERADAKLLAATLNRDLVKWIVILNHGEREEYPRIKIGRPDEIDAKVTVETAAMLADMGVEIDAEDLREQVGLPAPKQGGAILQPRNPKITPEEQSPNLPSQGQKAVATSTHPARSPSTPFLDPLKLEKRPNRSQPAIAKEQIGPDIGDGIDEAAEEALSDWEEIFTPVVGSIEELFDGNETIEEFRNALAGSIQNMDVTDFTQLLAQSGFGSRLLGDVDARGKETGDGVNG
jgi:phage gp29-like protein